MNNAKPLIPRRHSACADAARQLRIDRDARLSPQQQAEQERELKLTCEQLAAYGAAKAQR